jgi:hypothetical protein
MVLREEIIRKETETIFKNHKPANEHIKKHLGSEKITETTFGGFKHHKDDIAPYPPFVPLKSLGKEPKTKIDLN